MPYDRSSRMFPFGALSFSVLLIALIACAGANADDTPETGSADTAALSAAGAPDTSDARVRQADLARIKGDSSATVWLLIVSDFQCPYCKQWHDATAPAIEREYVQTGKIRVAYVQYPILELHPNALPAAEASMCAGAQGKFWAFHEQAFARQDEWARLPDANPVFDRIVNSVGIDRTAYDKCRQDNVMLPMIQADLERSRTAGVNSTPTFLVGGRMLAGAQYPFPVMKAVIDSAIAEAARGPR